jgi:hypothetical protein
LVSGSSLNDARDGSFIVSAIVSWFKQAFSQRFSQRFQNGSMSGSPQACSLLQEVIRVFT